MCPLNHRPPGALPPFSAFALTARGGFAALPGVSLPTVACPGLQANPPSSGLGWPSAILRSAELYRTAIIVSQEKTDSQCAKFLPCPWHFECQRPVLRVPAAGNSITSGWQFDSQRLGTRFPAAGNTIPKGWEHDSQGLDKTKSPYLSGKRAQFSKTLRKFAHKRATERTIVCFMVAHTTLLIPIPTHATHF